jgi:small subunit ribosomal protein S16
MLTIRLARIGKKNKPFYRLVISQKKKDLYGDALEILGSYNPHTKELKINGDKIKYWLSKGAGMSATVNNLLIEKKIIDGKKVKASKDRKAQKAKEEAKAAKNKTAATPAQTAKTEATPTPAQAAKVEAPKAETPKIETPKAEKPAV